MHGIGGSECEWGLNQPQSQLKNILDNLIGNGDIEPLIVVTPNGKALGCKHSQDMESFYNFGYELRTEDASEGTNRLSSKRSVFISFVVDTLSIPI